MEDRYYIFTDGSCWPSSSYGYMCWGWSITKDRKGGNSKGFHENWGMEDRSHLNTSPLSEYTALHDALIWIKSNVPSKFVYFRSDSKQLVNQMNGLWKIDVTKRYGVMAQKCKNLVIEMDLQQKFDWVWRGHNKYADSLSNRGYVQYGIETLPKSEVYKITSRENEGIYVDGQLKEVNPDEELLKKMKKCYNFTQIIEHEVNLEEFPQELIEIDL